MWFAIDKILALDFLAILTASRTSALSPLCETAIKIEFGSIESGNVAVGCKGG